MANKSVYFIKKSFLSKTEFIKSIQGIDSATSITGVKYSNIRIHDNKIIGIRETTLSSFQIPILDLYKAYINLEKFTLSTLKPYVSGIQSPSLAILIEIRAIVSCDGHNSSWEITDTDIISDDEVLAIKNIQIVTKHCDWGESTSMCFCMRNGDKKYCPLLGGSMLKEGDEIDPTSIIFYTLSKEGEDDIYRCDGILKRKEPIHWEESVKHDTSHETYLNTVENKHEKEPIANDNKQNTGCFIIIFIFLISGIPAATKGEGPIGAIVISIGSLFIAYLLAKKLSDKD